MTSGLPYEATQRQQRVYLRYCLTSWFALRRVLLDHSLYQVELRSRAAEVRRRFISENYVPLHSDLACFDESFVEHEFLHNYREFESSGSIDIIFDRLLCLETSTRLFSFRFFNERFLASLTEEIDHFMQSGLPRLHSSDISLFMAELGFTQFTETLRKRFIAPLSKLLFTDFFGGIVDSSESFVFKFERGEQHQELVFDPSLVTMQVSLRSPENGGEIVFNGHVTGESSSEDFQVENSVGKCLLFHGRHLRHYNIVNDGARMDWVIWFKLQNSMPEIMHEHEHSHQHHNHAHDEQSDSDSDGFIADVEQVQPVRRQAHYTFTDSESPRLP